MTDSLTRDIERWWGAEAGADLTRVDFEAIGYDVHGIAVSNEIADLDPQLYEALALLEPPAPHPWRLTALPHQIEAAEATQPYVVLCAGRGAGKTYTASHTLTEWVEEEPGDYAIIAPTFGDAIKICTEGPSGFLKAAGDRVESFNKNEFIVYMKNGSRVVLASADAPDRVRGWNLTGFWADELASWKRAEIWDEGLEFATRIGRTRRIITTTPKRGSKVLKDLLKRIDKEDPDVKLVRASTSANAANLSETFLRTIQQRYAGTTLGRQELDGVLLGDVEGALVTGAQIERARVRPDEVPELWRLVVGVDPAVTNTSESDETGIIVAGIGPAPDGWEPPIGQLVLAGAPHVYLLEDVSGRRSVDAWAKQALLTSDEWAADAIVAEKNQGYDLVESNIRLNALVEDLAIPNVQLVHAAKGKYTRAEPVGALFEQGRLHVVNTMPKLEDQWTEWIPGDGTISPDRLDASVWAVVGLMPELGIGGSGAVKILSAG
jgi:phage terminase large subunit-like protein